jgi:CBS domain-containing protein
LFRDRIRDPIGSEVYATREGFDFSLIQGESLLVAQLREAIFEEQEKSEAFLAVMANDTLAKLPPLTFFQGMALEMDGRVNQVLDVEKTVLNPITDASRVLAFSNRDMSTANTIERLMRLGRALPIHTAVFSQAADAWRIACYHQVRTRIRNAGKGSELTHPLELARLTRLGERLLKTAFDSTRKF